MTDDGPDERPYYPSAPDSFAQRRATYSGLDLARIRLAETTRRILAEQADTVADAAAVDRATVLVAEAVALLAGREHGRPYEGTAEGSLRQDDPRAFIDFSPIAGTMSPIAPPLAVEWDGDTIVGRATYGLAYEGPPGCVHGGFVAAGFDELLGYAQSTAGHPGMTVRLTVNYRSPTPLHREVVYRARWVRTEGRKVYTEATLHAGETLCADSDGLFVSVKPEVFDRLFAARIARGA